MIFSMLICTPPPVFLAVTYPRTPVGRRMGLTRCNADVTHLDICSVIAASAVERSRRPAATKDEHPFAHLQWCSGQARSPRRLRRAGAQPQGRHGLAAARRADRHHRALGLRQVVASVRHDLCRGPAPLRRVAERLRAPVPRADGQARRRLDRGPLAGDLDRPEDDVAQPALDGRHGHGDLRLPAPAVGARRAAALPRLRGRDRGAVGRADRRPGDGARRGHALHGHGADRARAQGRVRQGLRRAAHRRLRAREGRRRAAPARGPDRPRQEVQARHLGGRRPARAASRRAQAARRLGRDGGRARRRDHRDRAAAAGRHRRADAAVLRALRVPEVRHVDARARAADLLVQLAARGVRALHGARLAARDRPRADRARSGPVDRRGRAGAVGEQLVELLRADHGGDRGALRGRSRGAVERPLREAPRPLPVRHQRRAGERQLPQPLRPPALLPDALRGDHPQPRAALQGDRLRVLAREDRGVHERAAVPGLQGRAAAARVARGADRRARDPRVRAAVGRRGAALARRGAAHRDRAPHRAADPARDRGAAALPRERRDRLPVDGPRGGDAVGRRGAAHPAGDADRVVARGRAVHPRRAVDRLAPARQLEAHPDAWSACATSATP